MTLAGTVEVDECVNFDIYGRPEEVTALVQGLAWLGAVLRSNPKDMRCPTYWKPITEDVDGKDGELTIRYDWVHLDPTETLCWLSLFTNPSIANGFMIPDRGAEIGLEIPLQMMAALVGTDLATDFDGGVVMKGYSSMFIPVKRVENRVQWHYVSNSDPYERLTFQGGISKCSARLLNDRLSLDDVYFARNFVGWCSTASTVIGSDLVDFKKLSYTSAEILNTSIRFSSLTLGIQQFAVAQMEFSMGPRDGRLHYRREGPLEVVLSAAENTPIVLYDYDERRAWLVSAIEVMLYVAQYRNHLDPCSSNGNPVQLPSICSTGPSLKKLLLQSESIELNESGTFKLGDMLRDVWNILEVILDHGVNGKSQAGKAIRNPLNDELKGVEFKAIVQQRSPVHVKKSTLKSSSGG